jgi:hypothetical protein
MLIGFILTKTSYIHLYDSIPISQVAEITKEFDEKGIEFTIHYF